MPPFSITVDPPAAPIHLRSPINVTITVTNITDKEIWCSHGRDKDSVYRAFAVLLMKDGREVETTIFDRKITDRLRPDDPPVDPGFGSSISLPHPPGKMFVMTIDLTKLYEITEPGTYTLNVRRIEDDNKTIVRAKPDFEYRAVVRHLQSSMAAVKYSLFRSTLEKKRGILPMAHLRCQTQPVARQLNRRPGVRHPKLPSIDAPIPQARPAAAANSLAHKRPITAVL